jgi:hypothetical protein
VKAAGSIATSGGSRSRRRSHARSSSLSGCNRGAVQRRRADGRGLSGSQSGDRLSNGRDAGALSHLLRSYFPNLM